MSAANFPLGRLVATPNALEHIPNPEIMAALQRHLTGDWGDVGVLSDLVAAGETRPAGLDLTLFKWMGVGLADLAAGIEIFGRAQSRGVGTPNPHPGRAAPDLS